MILVKNKLRVCHLPQIPCKPFIVEVENEKEAYKISNILAEQHCFLLNERIIPDYSNVITVEMYDELRDPATNKPYGWCDYYNDEEFMEFKEFCETYLD